MKEKFRTTSCVVPGMEPKLCTGPHPNTALHPSSLEALIVSQGLPKLPRLILHLPLSGLGFT